MKDGKEYDGAKRKYLEVDEATARKLQVVCFLKDVKIKRFVSETINKELEHYEPWIESVKKLKAD